MGKRIALLQGHPDPAGGHGSMRRCCAARATGRIGRRRRLKRNILEFCGVAPVRSTVIGMVEGRGSAREDWLQKVAVLGWRAA